MKEIRDKAWKLLPQHAHLLHNPKMWEPIYSFDNPTIHAGKYATEQLASLGISDAEGNVFELPHYCGDFQKPVEHTHGTLTNMIQDMTWQDRKYYAPSIWHKQVEHLFYTIPRSQISADVANLKKMYNIVRSPPCRKGTAGDWAPRPYS